jgi:hypothetical protein
MKKLDIDAECDFQGLSPEEIEAACLYEYMRESQILTDALNASTEDERKEKARGLKTPFFLTFTEKQFVRLMLTLRTAGFPSPWKALSKDSQTQLVSLLAGSTERTTGKDQELYPPVIIEQGAAEFDLSENSWRVGQLEPFELSLFKAWEHSGRRCFFGFIRIDQAYNETEVVAAFKKEFGTRWERTKGGNRERWAAWLKNLVVMRLWKRFPGKGYRDLYKRLKLVAEFCNYKGCVEEWAAYEERRQVGRGDAPMSNAAKIEMSSARSEARTFFQSLFPGEEPLSF